MEDEGIDFQKKVEEKLDEDYVLKIDDDPSVFHPSKLAYCIRQAYLSKLGLKKIPYSLKGSFRIGQLIHEYMEGLGVDGDKEITREVDFGDITFRGTADLVTEDVIYDYKSRKSWYKFNPPNEAHIKQVMAYMKMFDKEKARIVYLSKGNLEVKCDPTYGSNKFHKFDKGRFQYLLKKARKIRDVIEEEGIPEKSSDIPYCKCGCYVCEKEKLKPEEFEDIQEEEDNE